MPKRRARKPVKKPASSSLNNLGDADPGDHLVDKDALTEEVSRQSAAIRAIRCVENEQLLTQLRLLRSYFSKEELQTPLLQFFKDKLPNLEVVTEGEDGKCAVKWKNADNSTSMNQTNGSIHTMLLQQIAAACPDCSTRTSLHVVRSSLLSDNLRIGDLVLEEPSDCQLAGLQGLQTPGVNSQRLSVGLTPKTLRLPKHGEMLLSVHGSPLGVYKEGNMEAICETEEG